MKLGLLLLQSLTLTLTVSWAAPAEVTGKVQPAPEINRIDARPAAKPEPKVEPAPAAPAKPANRSETLHFNVNWPSGLSLGEGELSSAFSASGGWSFSMSVDAALPAFPIAESAKATAGTDLCTTELTKESTRGKRKTTEKTTFDSSKLTATRTTLTNNGGKSEIRTSACARDALTFVQFIRRELAAGRLPPAQPPATRSRRPVGRALRSTADG